MNSVIIKGNICYSSNKKKLITKRNHFLVCKDGICKGVFRKIPQEYSDYEIVDYHDALIIPGLIDLHIHAPQYAFRGTKMDLQLIEWLNEVAFKEEMKYKNDEYASKAYKLFADSLKRSATTRACVFATRHEKATLKLMDYLEDTGLITYVGKVNMDQNSLPSLDEVDAQTSLKSTLKWLKRTDKYQNTFPILTPRFIPSCSKDLLSGLKDIENKYFLPVQSHLSENKKEIAWVKELFPNSNFYGEVYDDYNLFGFNHDKKRKIKTIMAHCVHSSEEEINLMKKNGVFVAHCPTSNVNLTSGIAPVRTYLEKGINVGLGSDVAAGHSESLFGVISYVIQMSKLYNHFVDNNAKPIQFSEAFYLATLGGGKFFNKVGTFRKGYEFDAVIIDDTKIGSPSKLSLKERLERAVYLNLDASCIVSKYVFGNKINF